MISQLEKEVTLRYLKTRKKDGFLNIISIFSFIGISLGVAVLIIVMSVMNGFRTELVEKIVGFNPHAVIKTYNSSIDESIFNNKDLNNLSNVFVYSNSGEGGSGDTSTDPTVVLQHAHARVVDEVRIFLRDDAGVKGAVQLRLRAVRDGLLAGKVIVIRLHIGRRDGILCTISSQYIWQR